MGRRRTHAYTCREPCWSRPMPKERLGTNEIRGKKTNARIALGFSRYKSKAARMTQRSSLCLQFQKLVIIYELRSWSNPTRDIYFCFAIFFSIFFPRPIKLFRDRGKNSMKMQPSMKHAGVSMERKQCEWCVRQRECVIACRKEPISSVHGRVTPFKETKHYRCWLVCTQHMSHRRTRSLRIEVSAMGILTPHNKHKQRNENITTKTINRNTKSTEKGKKKKKTLIIFQVIEINGVR